MVVIRFDPIHLDLTMSETISCYFKFDVSFYLIFFYVCTIIFGYIFTQYPLTFELPLPGNLVIEDWDNRDVVGLWHVR